MTDENREVLGLSITIDKVDGDGNPDFVAKVWTAQSLSLFQVYQVTKVAQDTLTAILKEIQALGEFTGDEFSVHSHSEVIDTSNRLSKLPLD